LLHRPGAEVVLFNALAKVLVDENLLASSASSLAGLEQLKQSLANYGADKAAEMTGLTADAIRQLARSYAAAETALIMLPSGLAYPGHGKELAQAVSNLALLAGKIGREGSGLLIMAEKNNSQGAVDLSIFPTAGGKNAAAIIEGSQNGSVQALYILGENPVVAYPDRKKIEAALAKVPFLVVQDLFLTETAAKAHVVLPALSYAEKSGTFTSTERRLQKINRAMAPVGKSRSDFEILNDLLAKLGKATYASVADAFAALAKVVPAYAGLTLGTIADVGKLVAGPLSLKLVPVTGSVTAVEGGKYALVTGSALYHNGTLSRFGEGTTAVSPEGYLELGKEDAASLGIVDGVRLKVTSASGEVTLPAKVSNRLPKGVVFAPYHFGGQSINTVAVGAAVTPVSISK
ncbi:MAG TPA: molybdopterin-dependent oxidoreductase, partial [Geobacterales bacterium]|nr:molybdopterin-dependent oxidoreductase [Geobacterales bacterium]